MKTDLSYGHCWVFQIWICFILHLLLESIVFYSQGISEQCLKEELPLSTVSSVIQNTGQSMKIIEKTGDSWDTSTLMLTSFRHPLLQFSFSPSCPWSFTLTHVMPAQQETELEFQSRWWVKFCPGHLLGSFNGPEPSGMKSVILKWKREQEKERKKEGRKKGRKDMGIQALMEWRYFIRRNAGLYIFSKMITQLLHKMKFYQ